LAQAILAQAAALSSSGPPAHTIAASSSQHMAPATTPARRGRGALLAACCLALAASLLLWGLGGLAAGGSSASWVSASGPTRPLRAGGLAAAAPLRGGRPAATARHISAEEGKGPGESKSRSDDGFVMPQSAEEEKELQKKQGFWRSDFDNLSDGEKLSSPFVIGTLLVTALPFVWGTSVLLSGGE